MPYLSEQVKIRRRYTRSINLERDLEVADSVLGYTPTSKSLEVLERFMKSFLNSGMASAWTLTGVYGTGKSAFAHFLASLCTPKKTLTHQNALDIATESIASESLLLQEFVTLLPEKGILRAVVTAQREPMSHAIIRALTYGASQFWNTKNSELYEALKQQTKRIDCGEHVTNSTTLQLLNKVSEASRSGVLLIVDELGKCLEYTSQHHEDLYLLQQIAELRGSEKKGKIFLFCLLHQSFNDYAYRLTSSQRNEWSKIQGRFEDIAFADSSEQFIRLIGNTLVHEKSSFLTQPISLWSKKWSKTLSNLGHFENLPQEQLKRIYPLHPFTAIALPELCKRYAQNDRSLFTFLTSEEPFSLVQFLKGEEVQAGSPKLPTLKLHQLYDYFIETSGLSIASQPQFHKWLEIQGRIHDAYSLEPEFIQVLKTIGVLNLIGIPKASFELSIHALCDQPANSVEQEKWTNFIETLEKKGFITWRKQLDELRIWEGTDFNIEASTRKEWEEIQANSIAMLLERYASLAPVIAQRHSYKTGTLRYFEKRYSDKDSNKKVLTCQNSNSDGLLLYWVGKQEDLKSTPHQTTEGKPVVIVTTDQYQIIEQNCYEFVALKNMEAHSPQLQSDGVARREVRQRLAIARQQMDHALNHAFDPSFSHVCFQHQNKKIALKHQSSLNVQLSKICDEVYASGLHLWNELINRSVPTSQGVKASRTLIAAMLEHESEEKLGLTGYGPDRSMYESVLKNTGIHRKLEGEWRLMPPYENSGIFSVWKTIENFCLNAKQNPLSLEKLYQELSKPPYGVRFGVLPILFTSVLLVHADDIGVYYDGSFIPVLHIEHFKLLDKQLGRFSIKYFGLTGLRQDFFKELESVFRISSIKNKHLRNPSLLGIAKPLIQFVRKLPRYTLHTQKISSEAIALRNAVLSNSEPDKLLFSDLPKACGFPAIENLEDASEETTEMRQRLVALLRELKNAYPVLINRCNHRITEAFHLSNPLELRKKLQAQAKRLKGKCVEPQLKRFVEAVLSTTQKDQAWMESLLMVIADKPAESWHDDVEIEFENTLLDLSHRFIRLFALRSGSESHEKQGFGAKSWILTLPDGKELQHRVWIKKSEEAHIHSVVKELLASPQIQNNERIKMEIATQFLQKILEDQAVVAT